jgi:hypothetical protein
MSEDHTTTAVTVIEHTDVDRLHPMVRQAMAGAPDPATLRELLALQRDWEAGEAKRAFTAALVRLKADLPSVIKRDQTVDFTGRSGVRTYYTHTSLAAAMEAITGPITEHGFSLSWEPSTSPDGKTVTVSCRLTHEAGHSESAAISAPLDTSGNKSAAQGVASTITLLQRYTALSLLGIATADMRDPTPTSDNAPNAKRNLKAAANLKKYGKTAKDAEAFIGRPVAEWTREDLEALAAWVKPEPTPEEEEAAWADAERQAKAAQGDLL